MDSQANGKIFYEIASGDPEHQFKINRESGWISVAAPLDRESVSSYNLEIVALDQGIPQCSGSLSVYVEVSDANDNPPLFVETNHTAYVQVQESITTDWLLVGVPYQLWHFSFCTFHNFIHNLFQFSHNTFIFHHFFYLCRTS